MRYDERGLSGPKESFRKVIERTRSRPKAFRSKKRGRLKKDDPSIVRRVVREPTTSQEIIIAGCLDDSFGDTVRDCWYFKGFNKNSTWIIVDERGNNITDKPLSSFDGIAQILFQV